MGPGQGVRAPRRDGRRPVARSRRSAPTDRRRRGRAPTWWSGPATSPGARSPPGPGTRRILSREGNRFAGALLRSAGRRCHVRVSGLPGDAARAAVDLDRCEPTATASRSRWSTGWRRPRRAGSWRLPISFTERTARPFQDVGSHRRRGLALVTWWALRRMAAWPGPGAGDRADRCPGRRLTSLTDQRGRDRRRGRAPGRTARPRVPGPRAAAARPVPRPATSAPSTCAPARPPGRRPRCHRRGRRSGRLAVMRQWVVASGLIEHEDQLLLVRTGVATARATGRLPAG